MPIPAMTFDDLRGIASASDLRACHLELLRRRAVAVARACRCYGLATQLHDMEAVTKEGALREWVGKLMLWHRLWADMDAEHRKRYQAAHSAAGELLGAILLMAEARIADEPSA